MVCCLLSASHFTHHLRVTSSGEMIDAHHRMRHSSKQGFAPDKLQTTIHTTSCRGRLRSNHHQGHVGCKKRTNTEPSRPYLSAGRHLKQDGQDVQNDADAALGTLLHAQRVRVDDAVDREEKGRPGEVPACAKKGWKGRVNKTFFPPGKARCTHRFRVTIIIPETNITVTHVYVSSITNDGHNNT